MKSVSLFKELLNLNWLYSQLVRSIGIWIGRLVLYGLRSFWTYGYVLTTAARTKWNWIVGHAVECRIIWRIGCWYGKAHTFGIRNVLNKTGSDSIGVREHPGLETTVPIFHFLPEKPRHRQCEWVPHTVSDWQSPAGIPRASFAHPC